MRILLIGFLVWSAWAAFSTYIYVCKIKGLCFETEAVQTPVFKPGKLLAVAVAPVIQEKMAVPNDETIYFAFDKSNFEGNPACNKYSDQSAVYLSKNNKAILSITGYTDSVGTFKYNQALGYRRAQSLQRYFESKGILANKITITSMGETMPADNNNTTAGRANNRRTAITIKK